MSIHHLEAGTNVPEEVNVVIEIAAGALPVKYEVDKNTGLIFVDRFLSVAMHYPCNYGFIPKTLGGDGDPLDVLVIASHPIQPGTVIRVKPIGVLVLEDEAGLDEKIIAVPIAKVDLNFQNVTTLKDLPASQKKQILHFFEHYKDLEEGKWVKVIEFEEAESAKSLISKYLVSST